MLFAADKESFRTNLMDLTVSVLGDNKLMSVSTELDG